MHQENHWKFVLRFILVDFALLNRQGYAMSDLKLYMCLWYLLGCISTW